MKKLLALVLALVMSMSLVTISNAAFKDADKISNKEAVDVMAAVGVLAGYDNGEFGATDTLTRAQACKIIAYLDLGGKTADAINTIMGNATDDRPSLRATVICAGGENCGKRFDYQGIQTCAAAASIAGGPSACAYGCLGLGDCTRACKFDAIHIINGVAVVDRKKCTGCTACTVACPRHVIQMKPIAPQPAVKCSNKDKGALVNKTCKVGCIACGLCVRNCPNQAIFLKDNVAVIDYTKCNGCGTCVSKCPKKAIQWVEGSPRPVDSAVPEHKVL